MLPETATSFYNVIIENAKRAKMHAAWIIVTGKAECMV
jgi:hypothetical protein